MPSVPSSPVTPSRRRRSLRLPVSEVSDVTFPSPYTSGGTNGTTFSRRSSRTSQTSYQAQLSPMTPRPMSSSSNKRFSLGRRRSSRASQDSNMSAGMTMDDGLGTLADELADAWDGETVEGLGSSCLDGLREGGVESSMLEQSQENPYAVNDMHDFGSGMIIQSPIEAKPQRLQPAAAGSVASRRRADSKKGHSQRPESDYDGSDYGPEDGDDGLTEMPPSLAKRLRDVEKITRMSVDAEDTLSEDGGVVPRTVRALKDLGPQSTIETGTTRLMTAYTSMTTHRTHNTRQLFSQAHSLLYGGVLDLPEETIELLIAEVDELARNTSFIHQPNPLLGLQILAANTNDLVHSLRSLSDVLQESRMAATTATRKLKSVKEMVEDMRLEEELTKTSIMLIQAGDWDRRCRERQAARACREVVDGFQKTCDAWRDRLLRKAEMEQSAAAAS